MEEEEEEDLKGKGKGKGKVPSKGKGKGKAAAKRPAKKRSKQSRDEVSMAALTQVCKSMWSKHKARLFGRLCLCCGRFWTPEHRLFASIHLYFVFCVRAAWGSYAHFG